MPIRRQWHLKVRSRNYSNAELKRIITPCCTIYRMGSVTPTECILRRIPERLIEINSIEGCKTSANKIAMKKKFDEAEIRTPQWFNVEEIKSLEEMKSLINAKRMEWRGAAVIVKRYNSSKGNGIYLISNDEELDTFLNMVYNTNNHYCITDYIFERYSTYNREYRLHVTKDGCFYACRKMLRNDAEVRWHRHDNNSVWITEENALFDKPSNWDDIVADCVKALEAVQLDIAAFDIKVQRSNGDSPKWLILECNSAPGLGEIGLSKYKEILPTIITNKYNSLING
jgi:glutathione synthase/RimK-type ligase-like ATP-grasp enzyme